MAVTSTFSPSLDGYTLKEENATWAAARSQTTGGANSSATYNAVDALRCAKISDADWRLGRVFLLFNTATIGAGSTIISATIAVTLAGHEGDVHNLGITEAYLQNTASLAASDHPRVYDTALSNYVSTGSTVNARLTYTLNATGLTKINKSGISQFSLRDQLDITNSAPTNNTGHGIYFQEHATTEYRPVLSVTYNPAPKGNPMFFSSGGLTLG